MLRSNKKQINWDQLDKEVSAELEGEKLEGDAALNKLFKDIYDRADEVCMPLMCSATATNACLKVKYVGTLLSILTKLLPLALQDTRRAMNKSMQTSGGTCLSTNWGEVKDKDYEKEQVAPKGMEWKKYPK